MHLCQVQDAVLIPAAVVEGIGIRRLLISALVHLDEFHLYYNMASLLWVGTTLERVEGSRHVSIQCTWKGKGKRGKGVSCVVKIYNLCVDQSIYQIDRWTHTHGTRDTGSGVIYMLGYNGCQHDVRHIKKIVSFRNPAEYMVHCRYYSSSIGFSAVLFAMKVILSHRLPRGMANIFGYEQNIQQACNGT